MLQIIASLEKTVISDIAACMALNLSKCILAASKHKLSSAVQAATWSAFHRLRSNKDILDSWSYFITTNIPALHQQECQLCLQLIMDRMLKRLIHNKAEERKSHYKAIAARLPQLTVLQINGIRYMAGYIAVKLLKKYKKRSKHPKVQLKWKMFARVLKDMKATDQPGMPNSPLEYSEAWAQLIDRGGLYHINNNVFDLVKLIESVTRQYINNASIATYAPGHDLRKVIRDEVLASLPILSMWESIAHTIPDKYEKYSIELLSVITDLWITIRGYSFAKEWTMKFERKYKRATRKELKDKKEEQKKEE